MTPHAFPGALRDRRRVLVTSALLGIAAGLAICAPPPKPPERIGLAEQATAVSQDAPATGAQAHIPSDAGLLLPGAAVGLRPALDLDGVIVEGPARPCTGPACASGFRR